MSSVKLTAKQNKIPNTYDVFAQGIFNGMSQYDAYVQAYPVAKDWKKNSVYSEASKLASNHKVLQRLEELRNPVQAKLRRHAEKFAQRIIEAADAEDKDSNPDHLTRLKAAEKGLDYAGYAPVQKTMNVNVDMSKEDVEKLLGNI